jgi:hypothetical protein
MSTQLKRTISYEQAVENFGPIILITEKYIVRGKTTQDGEVEIIIHQKEDGIEQLPRGYVLGSNILITKMKVVLQPCIK